MLSVEIATTWAPRAVTWAYLSRYAESSRVQPDVNAFGKNARMVGPCPMSSASVTGLPSVSGSVKGGAGWPMRSFAGGVPQAANATDTAHKQTEKKERRRRKTIDDMFAFIP